MEESLRIIVRTVRYYRRQKVSGVHMLLSTPYCERASRPRFLDSSCNYIGGWLPECTEYDAGVVSCLRWSFVRSIAAEVETNRNPCSDRISALGCAGGTVRVKHRPPSTLPLQSQSHPSDHVQSFHPPPTKFQPVTSHFHPSIARFPRCPPGSFSLTTS